MHPATEALLDFFEYEHLPNPAMRAISKRFHDLAHGLANDGDLQARGAELTTALRKLLEAKDCAVRAALPPAHSHI